MWERQKSNFSCENETSVLEVISQAVASFQETDCRAHGEHVNIWVPVNPPWKSLKVFCCLWKLAAKTKTLKEFLVPGQRTPRRDDAVMFILFWRISVQYSLEWLESYSENAISFFLFSLLHFFGGLSQQPGFNVTDHCVTVAPAPTGPSS